MQGLFWLLLIFFTSFSDLFPLHCMRMKNAILRELSYGDMCCSFWVLFSYFLIFPFTFRFLALYQVSPEVENTIMLSSYIDTLTMLSLMMGITFEIPILAWLFAKLGFLTADFMTKYRKHALVISLVIAAIITPTSDVVTLLIVTFPMFVLYEVSIFIVRRTGRKCKSEII